MYREDVQRFIFDNVLNFSFDMSKLTPRNVYNNIGYRSFQAQLAGFLFFNYLTGILFGLYGIYFGTIFGSKYAFEQDICNSCVCLVPKDVRKVLFNNFCFDECYCNPCRCPSCPCCDVYGYSKTSKVSYFSYGYMCSCCCVNEKGLLRQFATNLYDAIWPFRSYFSDCLCCRCKEACVCPQLFVALLLWFHQHILVV